MEDNRKFATFFADAPKGKKIGAVLSWIATAILLVALFVPGYRVEFQTKESEKGEYTTASGPKAELLKESWKESWFDVVSELESNEQRQKDSFLSTGKTSGFEYLTNSTWMRISIKDNKVKVLDPSKVGIALLLLFFAFLVIALIAGVYTISWASLTATFAGTIELMAVYFFIFRKHFYMESFEWVRWNPVLSPVLIALLVLAAIMSVASVIVSYAVHEDEEAFVDDWNSNDPSRDAETNLVDDGNATTVPATDNSMTVVASLIQMNTNRSFAIYNNTEVVIGKGSQANIIVSNPIISRAHAKISCRNGVCTIQDLGSKNGTFVGDEKILGSNTVTLANGMYITLGNEIFQFKN